MRRRQKGFWLIAFFLLAAGLRWFDDYQSPPPPPTSLPEGNHRVQRVVDGDTLVLEGGARIRLLGIDTPEMGRDGQPPEPYALEARDYLETMVAKGTVRLQFDRERIDQYGRFLAYVYVGDTLVNESLIREGLAKATPWFNFSDRVKKRFLEVEAEARRAKRGIWSGS